MADAKAIKKRPGQMRLIDATQYRLPPAGWVSILHRVSGLLLIVLMPFVIWMFDTSLSSERSRSTSSATRSSAASASCRPSSSSSPRWR
jgi:succinate dehydrogenase cytochrome b556 subunit